MQTPLLQTQQWQHFQQALGKTTFFGQTPDFTYLAILENTPIGNYLYLPYGPIVADPNSFQKSLISLKSLAKSQKCLFIRLEPQNLQLEQFLKSTPNFQKSKDLNPKETWTLDLTADQSTIIQNFSQGTRTRYNQFKNKGLSVKVSQNPQDIDYLVNLQHKLAKEKHFLPFDPNYLKTELEQDFATLYLVSFEPKSSDNNSKPIVAASLFFDYKNTRYYMQSAADSAYKKLPATVALLTTAIFDAKAKGLKSFDFWGVAPENAPKNHPWLGFTEFKKSFGGQMVQYCGTYDYVLNRPKYTFYKLIRTANRFVRRLTKTAS